MVGSGEKERETIRPEFDRSIMIDFQGAKIDTEKRLTELLRVRYAQRRDKNGFLINITTVLPASARAGHSAHTFSGSVEPLHPSRAHHGPIWTNWL
jgi:hypothetical protein